MIYNIIFLVLLALSLIELYMYSNSIVVKPHVSIGIFISIFLIIFAGGRVNTGLDYAGYERYFIMAKNGSLEIINSIVEPMYVVLNRISPSYRVLLFIMAIGCVAVKYIAFRKLDVKLIALVMFFYYASFFLYYDMGIMRQGLAMGICLLAIPYAEKKKKRFFVFIAVAALFHITALLFSVIYFFAGREYSRTLYYLMMGIAIILAIFASSGVAQNSIFERLIGAVGGDYINYKFNRYISQETQNHVYTILKRAAVGVIFVEWFKRMPNTYDDRKQAVWTYLNGYVISMVGFSAMSLLGFASHAGRITAGLYMLYCLIYETMLRSTKHRLMKMGLLIIFVAMSFNTLNNTVTRSSGDLYSNYQFFIQ